MLESSPEKPRLIIDTEMLTPEEFNFVSALEKDIHTQPALFLRAFGSITIKDDNGKASIQDSWAEKTPQGTEDTKVTAIEERIRNYLDNNYGRAVELDEDGEDLLTTSEIYAILINTIHTQKGTRAETAKSQLARLTLHIFTEKVEEWKKVTEINPMPLPEAS